MILQKTPTYTTGLTQRFVLSYTLMCPTALHVSAVYE